MPDIVDIRVSPALDPDRLRLQEGYNDETRPFVDDVVNAFNDIYVTLGKIHDARRLAESNGAWTPENRVLIVGRESQKQKDRVLLRLARAERDLRARISYTERELTQPLTERAGLGTVNGEVRAFAKSLNRSEREKFMAAALERDDGPTLDAILGAQPFLSGMSHVEHDHYVYLFHTRRNPHLVRRLDLMKRFLAILERDGGIVHQQFDKAVGAKPKAVSAINAADAAARAALKIEPTA